MIEIILTLSLFTSPNVDIPIQIQEYNQQFTIDSKNKILVNNKETNETFNLIEGENTVTVISPNNEVLEHILVITQPKICDYLNAKIEETNIEKDYIKLDIPDNCTTNKFKLYIDSFQNIESETLNTNLVSTAEAAILFYEDKIIDYTCWINSKISKTEEKDFEKFKIDKTKCTSQTEIEEENDKHIKNPEIKPNQIITENDIPEVTIKKTTTSTKPEIKLIKAKDITIEAVQANSDNEFIVLKNNTQSKVDLQNLYLTDKTNKQHFLEGFLDSDSQTKIDQLTFTLNNSNEEIFLINSLDNKTIDHFSYKSSILNEIIYKNSTSQTKQTAPSTDIKSEQKQVNIQEIPKELQKHNQIQITEIHPNPKGLERENEFIELHNPNDFVLNTTSYKLTINTKEVELPKQLKPFEYWSTQKKSITNNQAKISLYFQDKLIDEFTYQTSPENFSYKKINKEWVLSSLKSRDKHNGEIIDYNGELTVENNVLQIESNTIQQNTVKLENGHYENTHLKIHLNNDKYELIQILESDLQQKTKKTPENDITSMGILSMASLAVVYNFIK